MMSNLFNRKSICRIFFLLLFLIFYDLSGQTIIEGKIKDTVGNPVEGATVLVKDIDQNETFSYALSDTKGYFKLTISQNDETLFFVVRSMVYETQTLNITNKNQIIHITLKDGVFELEEVQLKHEPIRQRKDTLGYKVSSFSEKNDRSIADVIKHLPGVSINNDGQIFYQGKPINRFYIENMDLLGGKYNLASENLPHKEVEEIQVLENHQPIKVLDSLVFSDKAALNLKLKKTYTFTGQVEGGAGFSPALWEVNLTPMVFTKKKQALVTYQANNTGKDLEREIKPLLSEKPPDLQESITEGQEWLNILEITPNTLPKKRWLDNNAHLVSGNALINLEKDYNLRLNVSYLNDYQKQKGNSKTLFFTASDTLPLFETISNDLYDSMLDISLRLNKNTEKTFFNNTLNFKGYWNSRRGEIIADKNPVQQKMNDKYFNLSNQLSGVFTINQRLFQFDSYIDLDHQPENLWIQPGQFESLLNQDAPYQHLQQEIDAKTLYTKNAIGFTQGVGSFSISTKLGFDLEYQKLQTNLFVEDMLLSQPDFQNDFHWFKNQSFIILGTQFMKDKWRISLQTPIRFHVLRTENKSLVEKHSLNRFSFEPRFSLRYTHNSLWNFRGSFSRRKSFGGIQQIYPGYILQDYRNINRHDADIPENMTNHFSVGIYHKNVLKAIFGNISYSLSRVKRNLMSDTRVHSESATERSTIKKSNRLLNHNLSGEFHKYFYAIKTNIKLNADYDFRRSQLVLNDEFLKVHTQRRNVQGKVETKFTDWLKLIYKGSFSFLTNKLQNQNKQKTYYQAHQADLEFNINENSVIKAKNQFFRNHLSSGSVNSFFADLEYRFSLNQTDFEISYTNIFNNKTYQRTQVSDFMTIQNNYELRPWEIMVKVRFSL